jgi:hypothetical protein
MELLLQSVGKMENRVLTAANRSQSGTATGHQKRRLANFATVIPQPRPAKLPNKML